MSTTPVKPATPEMPPSAPALSARQTKEQALSRRIRRSTLRRRLLQATDALAVADLLLGMNRSLSSMEDEA